MLARTMAAVVAAVLALATPPADDDRARAVSSTRPFTIAVIPDSQHSLVGGNENYLMSQTQWLVDNASDLDLAFVLHEGDLVTDLCDEQQWEGASDALRLLEDAEIGYAVSPGNHDTTRYDGCLEPGHTERYLDHSAWDRWFPISRVSEVDGYGGSQDGSSANSWFSFERSGTRFVVVALEFGPFSSSLSWASEVLAQNSSSPAIVLTHDMIGNDGGLRGTVQQPGESANRTAQPSVDGQNGGQDIWDHVVSPAPNVLAAVNGHVVGCAGGPSDCASTIGVVGRSVANNAAGEPVARMLANYQSMAGADDTAYIRLLTFFPDEGVVQVKTVSPSLGKQMTDGANQFYLDMPQLRDGAATPPFSDSGAFATETMVLRGLGIVNGHADGTFRPADRLSRQAAAAMIWRILERPATSVREDCASHGMRSSRFSDVPVSSPFCWPIHEMVRAGLISGYDDGTFRPSAPVTRQALAAFMYDRSEPTEDYPFVDVGMDHPFRASIASAYETGVVNGYADGTFRPGDYVTRDATAAMLSRLYFAEQWSPRCLAR